MSKLDELIKKYCPNGVKFMPLHDFCEIYDGTHNTPEYKEHGVKFVSVENIENLYATDKYISEEAFAKYKVKPKIGDILMTRIGSIGICTVVDRNEPLAYYVSLALIRPNNIKVNSLFLKYAIESLKGRKELRKRTLINAVPIKVNKNDIGKIILPVPPLPVQEEIVRILDSFTSLTAELQDKLNDELQARKKQYEYYADKLFVSDIPIEDWMSVGDTIQSLKTGLNPRQSFKLNVGGDKPYITGKNIYNNSINVSEKTDLITDDVISLINKRACLATGDVLFASTGTGTVGRMAVVDNYDFSWSVSETIFCLKPKTSVIHPYYLMYALYTQSAKNQFEPRISKGSVPHLKVKDLLEVKIPVPNMNEQKRIINLMKKFDSLCNNISKGLPAEIAARQKQYEYYRDKLLTFKELS